MYGAAIETDFQHIAFEQEKMKRKLEMRRLLESDQQQPQHARLSLATIFRRISFQFEARTTSVQTPIPSS